MYSPKYVRFVIFAFLSVFLISCTNRPEAVFLYGRSTKALLELTDQSVNSVVREFKKAGYSVNEHFISVETGRDNPGELLSLLSSADLVCLSPELHALIPQLLAIESNEDEQVRAVGSDVTVLYLGKSLWEDGRLINVRAVPDLQDESFIQHVSKTGGSLLYSREFLENQYSSEVHSGLISLFSNRDDYEDDKNSDVRQDSIGEVRNQRPYNIIEADNLTTDQMADVFANRNDNSSDLYIVLPPLQIDKILPEVISQGDGIYATYFYDTEILDGGFRLDLVRVIGQSLQKIEKSEAGEIVAYLPFLAKY